MSLWVRLPLAIWIVFFPTIMIKRDREAKVRTTFNKKSH